MGADGSLREAKDSVSCIPVIAFAKLEVGMAEQAGCPGVFEVDGIPERILSRDEGFISNPMVGSCSACPQDVSFFI